MSGTMVVVVVMMVAIMVVDCDDGSGESGSCATLT